MVMAQNDETYSKEKEHETKNNQKKWEDITNILKTVAAETVGYMTTNKKVKNHELQYLSEKQKQLRILQHATNNPITSGSLKKERHKLLNKLHIEIKKSDNTRTENLLKNIPKQKWKKNYWS